MSTVDINLGERSYDIRIDGGLLSEPEELMQWIKGNQVFVITNEVVAPLYLQQLLRGLEGKEVHQYILPDGESVKNLDNFSMILDQMLAIPCDRSVTVIALGGGVVGDLAGFVAASYQRGVSFIQAPTTLLAQVDASVGGKTGVNHSRGKNMVGAFYQPKRVIADIDTLNTLPQRELSAGVAEIIKYGLINDYPFFCWLEENMARIMALDMDAIDHIVAVSCRNKANIVQQDEREGGIRALLNLGHTFGHAIETATGYERWLHGEAVAIGMSMAATMSMLSGWISASDVARINNLLEQARLPWRPFAGVSPETMRSLMQIDKKVENGQLRLVLLKALGQACIVSEWPAETLQKTIVNYAQG